MSVAASETLVFVAAMRRQQCCRWKVNIDLPSYGETAVEETGEKAFATDEKDFRVKSER